LPEASPAMVRSRAEELLKGVQGLHFNFHGVQLRGVTASVGVAAFPGHGKSVAELLSAADGAMYAAKRQAATASQSPNRSKSRRLAGQPRKLARGRGPGEAYRMRARLAGALGKPGLAFNAPVFAHPALRALGRAEESSRSGRWRWRKRPCRSATTSPCSCAVSAIRWAHCFAPERVRTQ